MHHHHRNPAAKPIDLLAQYINNAEDDDHAVQVTEPYNLLNVMMMMIIMIKVIIAILIVIIII